MQKVCFALVLGCALFSASHVRAEVWGIEHPAARVRLLKVFENHPGFREALTEWTINHHRMFRELTLFLADKDTNNVAEFIRRRERRDEEVTALERIVEKHREGMAEYRVFVKEHKEAALKLVEREREIEHLDREAERKTR